jgi:ABC-type polysaccharide/polyol phosphate transport system ATPase subunit
MTSQELKKGSIVKMCFTTSTSEVKENWTIIETYNVGNTEFEKYVADCVVCKVTDKFFSVIIPHSNKQSRNYSKRCFTNTKFSYADKKNFKAEIVLI